MPNTSLLWSVTCRKRNTFISSSPFYSTLLYSSLLFFSIFFLSVFPPSPPLPSPPVLSPPLLSSPLFSSLVFPSLLFSSLPLSISLTYLLTCFLIYLSAYLYIYLLSLFNLCATTHLRCLLINVVLMDVSGHTKVCDFAVFSFSNQDVSCSEITMNNLI